MSERSFYRTMVGTAVLTYTPNAEKCWACWPSDNPSNVLRSHKFREVMNRAKDIGGVNDG